MLFTSLIVAAVISPLVRFLYNPSRRYVVYKKRSIQNIKQNGELRILASVYNEGHVPTIINILGASNPTRECPIYVYLLHIVELVGRSAPLLISHKPNENLFQKPSPSDHIINGFKIYEKQNQGLVLLQPFTAITPFLTAHDDICSIALDKRTAFIIIPFHMQWNIDGTTQTCKWRNANKKVLKQAPCSVGILIDRGGLNGTRSILSGWSTYKVGVIFLGDADDREATSYAMRMSGNPNVYVTVHRVLVTDSTTNNVTEKMLDSNVLNEYRLNNVGSERDVYKEEVVKDGVGIINLMRTMQSGYDLILVGRNHESYAELFSGLSEWNEYDELGFFGDIFASSDFEGTASVLVVQQHFCMSKGLPNRPAS